jgi:aprataxin
MTLMSPKPKKTTGNNPNALTKMPHFYGREGLGAYTHDPTKYPPSRVIYYDDDVVAINDLYPKSSVHTLLLPRSAKNVLHPFEAFDDETFLARVRVDANKLRILVAKELRRKYATFSASDEVRERILTGEDTIPEGEDLPRGRDWEKDVMVGIHAVPSMSHLHVHIMSVDRFSECLKHRKHYNSFSTPFFVPLDDFPLAKNDVRRHPDREGYLNQDFKCWRCKKTFGRSFSKLKAHLAEEFEEWKKE